MLGYFLGTNFRGGFGTLKTQFILPFMKHEAQYKEYRLLHKKHQTRHELLELQLNDILKDSNDLIEKIKECQQELKEITPVHYAALIIGSRSYIKVWVDFFIQDIIPTLSMSEKDHQTLKMLLSLESKLSKKDFNRLVSQLTKDMNPKTGILLSYYFPEVITSEYKRVIEKYLIGINSDSEAIDSTLQMFEKRTRTFFSDISSLLAK